MEYNTQFINNINNKIDTAYDCRVDCTISSSLSVAFRSEIIKSYKISPGIIGAINGNYFSVIDRNLKPNKQYNKNCSIKTNSNNLSFNEIRYHSIENPDGYSVNYNKKYYLSSVSNDGKLYNVFLLPLDLEIPNNVSQLSWLTDNIIEDKDTLKNVWENINYSTNELMQKYKCTNFIYLGIYAKNDSGRMINPSDVTNPKTDNDIKKRDKAISTIIQSWDIWIKNQLWKYPKSSTFEKFLNIIINNDNTSEEIKKIIKASLKLCSKNIKYCKIEENFVNDARAKFIIDGEKYDIYGYASNKNIDDFKINGMCYIDKNENLRCQCHNTIDFTNDIIYESGAGNFDRFNLIDLNQEASRYKVTSNTLYSGYLLLNFNYNNIYPVAVKAKHIIQNTISLIYNDKLYTYKKIELGNDLFVSFFELENISNINESTVFTEKELDKILLSETFITPSEYYGNALTYSEFANNESGFAKVSNGVVDANDITWFWSNTLMNWCTFKSYSLPHTIKLYVWNGKTGWDSFDDVLNNPAKYNYISDKVKALKRGIDFSVLYAYDNLNIKYKTIILTNDSNFSQYTNDFQTIRLSKIYIEEDKKNHRIPFTIGIPPCMRLASGEIALLYELTLPGCDNEHSVIYQDQIKFINTICKSYFGDGNDKTIKDDWKRIGKSINKSDEPSQISLLNDSTLVDADEINTVIDSSSKMTIKFVPFKQYIETDNIESDSYVERWN